MHYVRMAQQPLGFEMRVIVYDPFVDPERVELPDLRFVNFEELLQQADFVSLHAPLTNETGNMMGASQFETMNPSSYLINTARGGLVDESALYTALTRGQIAGAALDVFIDEPPRNSPLLE